MEMTNKNKLIKLVSAKLFWPMSASLVGFFFLFIGQTLIRLEKPLFVATPFVVILMGVIGGFVSIQRRLNGLPEDKLEVMANSLIYTLLAPFVGGVLAFLLYMLFVSGLLKGKLFPEFVPNNPMDHPQDFLSIFEIHLDYLGYAGLVFWSFVAGYSEKFVTNIIGQFERDSTSSPKEDEKI